MTDSQTPRPTLKLSLKPATLKTLADKLPKQTILGPKEPEVATPKKEQQPQAKNKDNNPKPLKQEQGAKPQNKEVLPQVVEPAYDFFEVYGKLHSEFREVISLKNPKAFAIGIQTSIKEASGLSHRNAKMWTGEYLRRSGYYRKAHVAGANRYNLQGEIVGSVTKEQCDARQKIFESFKKSLKKA